MSKASKRNRNYFLTNLTDYKTVMSRRIVCRLRGYLIVSEHMVKKIWSVYIIDKNVILQSHSFK